MTMERKRRKLSRSIHTLKPLYNNLVKFLRIFVDSKVDLVEHDMFTVYAAYVDGHTDTMIPSYV